MRANVENMQTDMDRMRRTMESIGKGSSLVNTSLVEKRNRINQLSGVLGMLRKLQFVFELPSRLRNCLKLDAYDQAYRNYIRTSDVLSLYSHLPSFAAIQKDCDAIIKELIVKLRAKISKPDVRLREQPFCRCSPPRAIDQAGRTHREHSDLDGPQGAVAGTVALLHRIVRSTPACLRRPL